MFFKLHGERKIGYKLLSAADLGIGETSHQTHIGLAANVLTFMSDKDAVNEDSIFIYDNSFEYLDAHFDRIERKSGKFDAPKIKTGGKDIVSVTSAIRDIVKNNDSTLKWFLFWFGLKNEKAVFLLFNQNSEDYRKINELGLNLANITKGTKVVDSNLTNAVAAFVENKVNENGLPTIKKLEVESQIGLLQPNRRIGRYDIDRANANFKRVGRAGEELVNDYLKLKMERKEILHYNWYNAENESGLPYDFTIENHNGNIVNLDVKTTRFDFSQKLIFSNQEIDFITNTNESYNIYRVYYAEDDVPYMRVCENCRNLASQIASITNEYRKNLLPVHTDLKSAKLALSPNNKLLAFKQEIRLR